MARIHMEAGLKERADQKEVEEALPELSIWRKMCMTEIMEGHKQESKKIVKRI